MSKGSDTFKSTKLFIIGGVLTALYLAYPFYFGRGMELLWYLEDADFNQVGDFFAGYFAPLAFLWLIIGLRLQAKELQAVREEINAVVSTTAETNAIILEDKASDDLAARPAIEVIWRGAGNNEAKWQIENIGADARDFHLTFEHEKAPVHRAVFRRENFVIHIPISEIPTGFVLDFNSARGHAFKEYWDVVETSPSTYEALKVR